MLKKIHHLVFSTSSKNKSNKNSVIKLWSGAQNSGRHLLRAHLRPWDFTQPSFLFFFFFLYPHSGSSLDGELVWNGSQTIRSHKKNTLSTGVRLVSLHVLQSVDFSFMSRAAGGSWATTRTGQCPIPIKKAGLRSGRWVQLSAPHLETVSPPPTATPCTKAASQDPNNNSHNNNDNNNDRTDTVGAAWARTCHFWRSG